MHANPGDWLVVKSARDSLHSRRAAILAVSDGGAPPYTVRWTDTDREAVIFPGPDAEVITAAHQVELDQAAAERSAWLQRELAGHPASS